MPDTIRKQILAVRDSGRTNMFDTRAVQCVAYEMELFELVDYIVENRKDYLHFIRYGD